MRRTAAHLAEDVEARKPAFYKAPWTMELRGTQYTLVADEITVAALAAGKVTARLQCQAALLTRYLQGTEAEG